MYCLCLIQSERQADLYVKAKTIYAEEYNINFLLEISIQLDVQISCTPTKMAKPSEV